MESKTGVRGTSLLERGDEERAIRAAAESARAGDGAIVVIEAGPGLGKTGLVASAEATAMELEVGILIGRGGELERDLPFGIARQLFERDLSSRPPDDRAALLSGTAGLAGPLFESQPGSGGADADAISHALYWLTSNLADRRPLALCVDDAHAADLGSLRWLAYLSRRIADLPVLLVVAHRPPPEPIPELSVIAEAARSGAGAVLNPLPLSLGAVTDLLARDLGSSPGDDVSIACSEVTDGNPYLVRSLATQFRLDGGASVEGARRLGQRAVSEAALERMSQLGADAQSAARATAVLGQEATAARVAALANLDTGATAEAIGALATAGILEREMPPAFVHPTLQEAVIELLPPLEKARLHREAARILHAEGPGADAVAAHLLQSEPAADPDVVWTLREAARLARRRGAPESAARLLSRALREPPPPADRLPILEELARAESRYGDGAAVGHLRSALELTVDPRDRARLAARLGRILTHLGRLDDAFETFSAAQWDLGDADEDRSLELDAAAILAAVGSRTHDDQMGERLAHIRSRSTGGTQAERVALGTLCWLSTMAGVDLPGTRDLATRALADGQMAAESTGDAAPIYVTVASLVACDDFEAAEVAATASLETARRRGSTFAYAIAAGVATYLYQRWGRLEKAVALGENAVAVGNEDLIPFGMPVAHGFLCEAQVEMGDTEGAERVLSGFDLEGAGMDNPAYDILWYGRGKLRAARLELDGALSDLLQAGENQERWGARNPSLLPWRSSAAQILVRLGDMDRARELADEEVERARAWGAPRAIGVALEAAGLAREGDEGVEMLREAVEVLEAAPALARAHALFSLGSALRRAGLDTEARDPLRQALHDAASNRAEPLAESARGELIAAGGRPRRVALSGPDSLTPSELRIASLAAEGQTNREIAQELFLSVKTIEMHLRHAYGKLEIESRKELPEALS